MGSSVSVRRSSASTAVLVDENSDKKSGNVEDNIIRQLPHIDWAKFHQHSDHILLEYAKQLLSVDNKPEAPDPTIVDPFHEFNRVLRSTTPQKPKVHSNSDDSSENTEYNILPSSSSLTSSSSLRSPALQIAALQLGWSGVQILFRYIVYVASGGISQEGKKSLSQSTNRQTESCETSNNEETRGNSHFTKKVPLSHTMSNSHTLPSLYKEKHMLEKSVKRNIQENSAKQQQQRQEENGQQMTSSSTLHLVDCIVEDPDNTTNDSTFAITPSVISSGPATIMTNTTTNTINTNNTNNTTSTTWTAGISASHTIVTEPDGNKGNSVNTNDGINFLELFSTKDVLEQICSLAAHFDLGDEDLIQLMILPFEIAQNIVGEGLISFGDNNNASKEISVSSILRPLFSSMIVPILQGIRLIIQEKISQNIFGKQDSRSMTDIQISNKSIKTAVEDHLPEKKSKRKKTVKRLLTTVLENNGETGSNNDSSNNSSCSHRSITHRSSNNCCNGVKKVNSIPQQNDFSSIDNKHFFTKVSPYYCQPRIFQLLGEENCSIIHFAVSTRLRNTTQSLKEVALLAMEKSSEVLCPLRTRFISLRRQYIYVYNLSDTITPFTILPLSTFSTIVLDSTKSPLLETLELPPSGETFHVKRVNTKNNNNNNTTTTDNVNTFPTNGDVIVLDSHLCDVNSVGDDVSSHNNSTGEVRFGVYVLRVIVGDWVHHLIFQLDLLHGVWAHRVDVAHTMGIIPKGGMKSSISISSSLIPSPLSIKSSSATTPTRTTTRTTTPTTTTTTTSCVDSTLLLPVCFYAFLRGRLALRYGLSAFTMIRVLGTGTFGRVLLVRHCFTGGLYALKVIRKTSFTSLRNVIEVRRERAILDSVNSPYITRIHATFQTASRVYFLLDYLPGGELLKHTSQSPQHHFEEHVARFFIAELAIAIDHLQHQGIIHRDIKGDNLVLDQDGHAVLTDFGFAKHILDHNKKPIPQHMCCGTLAYIPPEMLCNVKSRGYGLEVDWWSLGVVLFTLLTGFFPFLRPTHRETVQAIVAQPLQFPAAPPLSSQARDLLSRLICKDPKRRLASMAELREEAFFRGFDWRACEGRQLPPPVRFSLHDSQKITTKSRSKRSKSTKRSTTTKTRNTTLTGSGVVVKSSHTDANNCGGDGDGDGVGGSWASAFLEEEEQIKLAQHVYKYTKDAGTRCMNDENDLFGDFYELQEMNGSERDTNSDFDYTLSMDWDTDSQTQRRSAVSLISLPQSTPPVTMIPIVFENIDDVVGDFNESSYISLDSMRGSESNESSR